MTMTTNCLDYLKKKKSIRYCRGIRVVLFLQDLATLRMIHNSPNCEAMNPPSSPRGGVMPPKVGVAPLGNTPLGGVVPPREGTPPKGRDMPPPPLPPVAPQPPPHGWHSLAQSLVILDLLQSAISRTL